MEIDNPTITMSTGAPAKMWVPRSYVESGVPRGRDLLNSAREGIVDNAGKSPAAEQKASLVASPAGTTASAVASVPPPAAESPSPGKPFVKIRSRVALVEVGHGELAGPLYRNLRNSGTCVVLDPGRFVRQAREAALAGPAEKSAFAARLQKDAGVNVVVYLMAPEGKGNALTAEAFDAMGGGLLRTFSADVPPSSASDPAPGDSAVSAALSSIADQITELVSYLPWYGRITEVDGERTYIAAGKETGLKIGQVLQAYRGGRFVKGLGFAPGERIGSLTISGFVGPDGSFGVLHNGQKAQPADLVSTE